MSDYDVCVVLCYLVKNVSDWMQRVPTFPFFLQKVLLLVYICLAGSYSADTNVSHSWITIISHCTEHLCVRKKPLPFVFVFLPAFLYFPSSLFLLWSEWSFSISDDPGAQFRVVQAHRPQEPPEAAQRLSVGPSPQIYQGRARLLRGTKSLLFRHPFT